MLSVGDPDSHRAAGVLQVLCPFGSGAAFGEFGAGERAEEAQQVGDAFGVAGAAVLGEPLEFAFQQRQHAGVEQFAQFGFAEEVGEEAGVDGEGGGAALGQRRVALVHELGDVAEQERAGEGGRLGGGDLDQLHGAGFDVAHEFGQPGHVVHVLEDLAHRLQDDRERRELSGDLQQLRGAQALLPQRLALAGLAARQEQGAGGRLAEAGGEQATSRRPRR